MSITNDSEISLKRITDPIELLDYLMISGFETFNP